MLLSHNLDVDSEALAAVCQRHLVQQLTLFGSATRDTFSDDSDIDIIVRFLPERQPNLFTFAGLELDLSAVFGRAVHLHTMAMIPERWRSRVLAGAKVAYAA